MRCITGVDIKASTFLPERYTTGAIRATINIDDRFSELLT